MRNLYLTLFLLFVLSQLSAQDCVINLPENAEWVGATKHPVGEYHGRNESVTIFKAGENEFEVSDISGGTFRLFGADSDMSAILTIDCDNTISQTTIESSYGPINISGGQWYPSQNKLEIIWSNYFNQLVDRVSILTLKN